MSRERLGNALPETVITRDVGGSEVAQEVTATIGPAGPGAGGTRPVSNVAEAHSNADGSALDPEAEAKAFVRFCYRRRAVTWPELYDEMCAVAARGDYRGMDYEQLQRLGIGFALAALPRLAALAERVIAEERNRGRFAAIA